MVSFDMSPMEIRRIRERLGLSQAEAGRIVGGGPRAFQKYEAGTVRPSASVIQLLRILDSNPSALASLLAERESGPFEADGGRIAGAISPQAFPSILRRLLSVEAQTHGLPQDGIRVTDQVTSRDGGEDGRIEWTEGPDRTTFLPARLCQFQLKTGPVFPASAAKEVVGRTGRVKPMIHSVLDRGGHYILLCTQAYTQQQIQDRKDSICTALRDAGMQIDEDRIDVRAAEQLAHWINHYPSVAIWLNEQTGIKTVGPFRSWEQWRQRIEHETSPWVEDDRLPALQEPVRAAATQLRRVVRVVGAVGIGKSRLALEALAPSAGAAPYPDVADLMMYANLAESVPEEVNRVVRSLVDNRQRAVVVVDNCPHDSHRVLAGIALQSESRVSLISMDYEAPPEMQAGVLTALGSREVGFRLPEAPSTVVEKVIEAACPGLPSEDFRRLTRVSQGNPEIALKVAQAWTIERPVAFATDEDIAKAYVTGRQTEERDLLLKAARLLAAFRLVALDADRDDGRDELEEVASFGRQLTDGDLRSMYERMIDRGAARRRGRFVTIEPRAIAVRLAERQWREWGKAERRRVLGDKKTSRDLKVNAAKQLALMNDTALAREVVRDVCGPGGPFEGRDGLLRCGHAEVLHSLAQIDPSSVANRVERSLDDFECLHDIRDESRRDLVWALEKIAFDVASFDIGARLLLRLALAENEHWGNNATGQFKALFPVVLGNTAADGNARLELLDDLGQAKDPGQQQILVEALIAGSATHHFSRWVGAETHGARPALESWHPLTEEVAHAYLEGCVTRLARFASGTGPVAKIARQGLGENLRSLASRGYFDLIEQAVETVARDYDMWPEARDALGHFLAFDMCEMPGNDEQRWETEVRIRSLMRTLEPQSLATRVRTIVTEMSWDYLIEDDDDDSDFGRLRQRQDDAVRELAVEMMQHPGAIEEHLPEISRFTREAAGKQRNTYSFGRAIAQEAGTLVDGLEPVVAALRDTPLDTRDSGMLAGYLSELPAEHAATVEAFKRRCAEDSDLAPAFPRICAGRGVVAADIGLALSSLQAGLLRPSDLTWWSSGGALVSIEPEVLAPLLDALLDPGVGGNDGYCYALELMTMYAYQKGSEAQILDSLRPQLRKAAENLSTWVPTGSARVLVQSHLEKLMNWLLAKGRDDADARSAAVFLSLALLRDRKDGIEGLTKRLVRPLLEGFPEISWQILGQAALSDGVGSCRLQFLLGPQLSSNRSDPPILGLPEEVLFAWCRANGDQAAAFAARTLPFLENGVLHPRMGRVIDEFGDRTRVRKALDANLFSGGFFGSASSFYGQYNAALSGLRDGHSSSSVRRWAGETLQALAATGEQFDRRDEEWKAQNED